MAKDIFKCKICGIKEHKDNLIKITKKGTRKTIDEFGFPYRKEVNVNEYYHESCKTKKDKEINDRNELHEVILDLHDLIMIPKDLKIFLDRLVRDTESLTFPIITESYKMGAKKISWAIKNKRFKTDITMLRYTFQIAKGYFNEIYQRQQRKEQQKIIDEVAEEQMQNFIENSEIKYKKKENKNDISKFLD